MKETARMVSRFRAVFAVGHDQARFLRVAVLSHEGTYSVMFNAFAVPVGTGYRRGYLVRPDKAGIWPTVIILPGLEGTSSQEKAIARSLARKGVAAVVVDPYPHPPSSAEEALLAYNALTDSDVLRVIDETAEFLSSPDVDWAHPDRLGLLGIDVGGRFAIIGAAHRPYVAACAVVATPLTGDEERRYPVAEMLGHIPTPLLGLYGAADSLIAAESVDEAQRRNPGGTWLLYEAAGHSFADDTSADYDSGAAADAIVRIIGFFGNALPEPREAELG